jgi:hypothetical protein
MFLMQMSNFNSMAEQPTTTMVILPESVWQEALNNQKKMLGLLQKKQEEESEWVESPKARKMLGVCAKTWQDYRDKRVIPFAQFGRKIYVKKADLNKFMMNHYIRKED